MKRLLAIILGLVFGISIFIPASSFGEKVIGIDLMGTSMADGVYCEINDVRLFALTKEDCEKAGGEVTHTVKTQVKEMDKE